MVGLWPVLPDSLPPITSRTPLRIAASTPCSPSCAGASAHPDAAKPASIHYEDEPPGGAARLDELQGASEVVQRHRLHHVRPQSPPLPEHAEGRVCLGHHPGLAVTVVGPL